jgi:hypothetical protein
MTETWISRLFVKLGSHAQVALGENGYSNPYCQKGHHGLPFLHAYHGVVCYKVSHGKRLFVGSSTILIHFDQWPTTWDHKNHKMGRATG